MKRALKITDHDGNILYQCDEYCGNVTLRHDWHGMAECLRMLRRSVEIVDESRRRMQAGPVDLSYVITDEMVEQMKGESDV